MHVARGRQDLGRCREVDVGGVSPLQKILKFPIKLLHSMQFYHTSSYASAVLGVVIRPPDMNVSSLIFYQGFFFLSSFCIRQLLSLNGTQPNLPHAQKWVRFENACPKSGVFSSPYKSGAQKPPFSLISQLNDYFNGLYLRNIDNRVSALTECHELWSRNDLKLDLHYVFFIIAGLHTHTSDNRTQPNFAIR